MRICSIAALLLSASPALSDAAACLAAPDRNCLFDLARDYALGEEKLEDKASDLLVVATTEARVGSDRADATLDQLLTLIAAEPEGAKRVAALNWAVMGAEIVGAPEVAARLADVLKAVETNEPDKRALAEARYRAHAGDMPAVDQLVDEASTETRADVALAAADALMEAGRYIEAYDLAKRVGTDEFRAELDRTALIYLLRQDQLQAAEVAAAMTVDPEERALALARVAMARAGNGQTDAALALIATVEPPPLEAGQFPMVALSKAEVLAVLGQTESLQAVLDTVPAGLVQPRRQGELLAVAALVAGDVDGFLAIVASAERPNEGGYWVKSAMRAWLQAGATDIEPLLARIPPVHLAQALNALGRYQAQAGELAAALQTLERLKALGPEARVHGDFRADLVRLMIERDDMAGAAALAVESKDPRLIAEVAGRMPD